MRSGLIREMAHGAMQGTEMRNRLLPESSSCPSSRTIATGDFVWNMSTGKARTKRCACTTLQINNRGEIGRAALSSESDSAVGVLEVKTRLAADPGNRFGSVVEKRAEAPSHSAIGNRNLNIVEWARVFMGQSRRRMNSYAAAQADGPNGMVIVARGSIEFLQRVSISKPRNAVTSTGWSPRNAGRNFQPDNAARI